MTDFEKIATVKTMLGDCEDATDDIIQVYLQMAENTMLKRLYPFATTPQILPSQYEMDECELAVRYINRRGAEGETSHNENSINRTYGSVDDNDILLRLIPFAKLL